MLSLSEIKLGKLIQIAGEPYVVIKAEHHKMGRGGAVLKTKLRNLINGNVLEKTFPFLFVNKSVIISISKKQHSSQPNPIVQLHSRHGGFDNQCNRHVPKRRK